MNRIALGLVVGVTALGAVWLMRETPEKPSPTLITPASKEPYRLGQNPSGKTREQLWNEAEKLGEEYSAMLNHVEQLKKDHERKKAEDAKVKR